MSLTMNTDASPELHSLFLLFNDQYFGGLLGSVEVKWSNRMTLCAGMCYYYPDGHGPEFQKLMHEINLKAGLETKITIYHSFNEEVNHYRVHVWECNGPCRTKGPYFGTVQRSMNRPPQKADKWFDSHTKSCGGQYRKIAGPEPSVKIPKAKRMRIEPITPKITCSTTTKSANSSGSITSIMDAFIQKNHMNKNKESKDIDKSEEITFPSSQNNGTKIKEVTFNSGLSQDNTRHLNSNTNSNNETDSIQLVGLNTTRQRVIPGIVNRIGLIPRGLPPRHLRVKEEGNVIVLVEDESE